MSIKKLKSGKWQVMVNSRVPFGTGFKSLKKVVSGSKLEAETVEIGLKQELATMRSLTGKVTSTSTITTFSDAFNLFRADNPNLKKNSLKPYETMNRVLGEYPLNLAPEKLKIYLHQGKARGLKQGAINRYISVVTSVYNHLVKRKIIRENPINKYDFPLQTVAPRQVLLTDIDIMKILMVIRGLCPWVEPIVKYMLSVPCRVSELTTAVKTQYIKEKGIVHVPTSKTGVALDKPVFSDMAEYFNSIPKDCPYLFYQKVGDTFRPINYDTLLYWWLLVREKAGFRNLHIHDLRHVAITNMIKNNMPIWVIKKICGWSANSNMLNIYFNVAGEEAAAEAIKHYSKMA
jgi:integrase